jgi:hypothetical protein
MLSHLQNIFMIKINKYSIQIFEHFDDKFNSIGFLNEFESLDLRCQIAEQKIEGYYLIFNGLKINIESDGKISNWPNGLYDINENLLARLFKAQKYI